VLQVIDTATSQWNLDFARAFAEGFRSVYVKMGGDNVDTYVAPWYRTQVDRARTCLFEHVGHYWVPDGNPADPDLIDTPTQQADYMIDRLHDWRRSSDFIVLDNEALDGAWMFTDAGAAEFIERVKFRLGIPGRQVAMYGGWYDLAGRQWPLVLATGAVFIVADYRTASQPGMNFPDLPTIPRDRIIGHQYGGRAIGGVITDTNTFVDHAFDYGGGSTVSLESKAREFSARYPTPASHPSGGDGSWDQDCGRVMFRFASFIGWRNMPTGDVSSAYRAYRGSRIESLNPAGAPVGAYHWWDIGGEANGHVAQQVDANTLIFMGSATVWEDLGVDIGFSSVAEYNRQRPTARYLGWSRDYSGGTISASATAGGGYSPIEEDDMFTDQDRKDLQQIRNALGAGGADDGVIGSEDTVLGVVRDSLRPQITNINRQVTGADGFDQGDQHSVASRVIDIQKTIAAGGVDVDALAAKVTAGVLAGIPEGSSITEAQVEAAVRRVFADAAD